MVSSKMALRSRAFEDDSPDPPTEEVRIERERQARRAQQKADDAKRRGNKLRRVSLCVHSELPDSSRTRRGKFGRRQLFAFSWQDLAVLFDRAPRTLQKLARKQAFNPRDLTSIVRFFTSRGCTLHEDPKKQSED